MYAYRQLSTDLFLFVRNVCVYANTHPLPVIFLPFLTCRGKIAITKILQRRLFDITKNRRVFDNQRKLPQAIVTDIQEELCMWARAGNPAVATLVAAYE